MGTSRLYSVVPSCSATVGAYNTVLSRREIVAHSYFHPIIDGVGDHPIFLNEASSFISEPQLAVHRRLLPATTEGISMISTFGTSINFSINDHRCMWYNDRWRPSSIIHDHELLVSCILRLFLVVDGYQPSLMNQPTTNPRVFASRSACVSVMMILGRRAVTGADHSVG